MNSKYVPAIQKPCPADWNAMQGDEKRRFCEHCQLHVHNLSAMTEREQFQMLKPDMERTCVRYEAEPDAKPVNVRQWRWMNRVMSVRAAAALVASGLLSCFGVSCQTKYPPPPSEPLTANTESHQTLGRVSSKALTMGAPVCPPTPWWKKMLFLD